MAIFKYFPPQAGSAVLSTGEVMVTPPKYFNDPFEFTPLIRCKDPDAYARRKFEEVTNSQDFFERNRASFPLARSFEEFREKLLSQKDERLKELAEGVRRNDLQVQNRLLDYLSSHFGVVCFASDGLHPVMWAQYACDHQGMVLEFDSKHPLFAGSSFLEIEYSDRPVTYDASDVPSHPGAEAFIKHKQSDWQHEGESRLVLPLSLMNKRDTDAGERYFLPLGGRILTSVTLGLHASKDLKSSVSAQLNLPELQHAQRFQIYKDPDTLTLGRLPVTL